MRQLRTRCLPLNMRPAYWLLGVVAVASILPLVGCAPSGPAPTSATGRATHSSPSSTTGGTTGSPIATSGNAGPGSGVPAFAHVFLVLMENHDYDAVIGNADAPYINRTLAAAGTVFTQYGNIAHPSLPNYLALTGGDTFGVADDNNPPDNVQHARNIVDLLEGASRTWRAYMEDMPAGGALRDAGPYTVHHDPFVYFSDIVSNPARSNRVVPYAQLSRDLASAATTPNFVWITPNLCNDMHDCDVSTGDQWLSRQVPSIFGSQACRQSTCLLAVVWDEDEGSGRIPVLLYGSSVRAGYASKINYNHYALLHTIEAAMRLPTLTANDAQARPMADAFAR
jgi:hypothetical protein